MIRADKNLGVIRSFGPFGDAAPHMPPTYMQTVHRLESYISQVDQPALSHGLFWGFQDLSRLRFPDIFDVFEAYRGTID
jgi:hypothetical protein